MAKAVEWTSKSGLPLWHVTLTVAGESVPGDLLRRALECLVHERPFMLAVRYSADRAELRYWDEAEDVDDAAALALRIWGDHRASCGLPPWRVVGVEVIDRDTVHVRGVERPQTPLITAGVAPL
ncbi:hypothetical protein ACPPVT_07210 [Angustibacter sp. McL0619]|uniref:hypothetical protein n=1 Tax=Angustibacter sp. McL0619 TaxID=3415676 RepID=UPI003CECC6DE